MAVVMPKSFVGNGRVAVDRCRDIGGDCKDLENPFNKIREVRPRFIKIGNVSVMASLYCENLSVWWMSRMSGRCGIIYMRRLR
jgi:hypothetical protein